VGEGVEAGDGVTPCTEQKARHVRRAGAPAALNGTLRRGPSAQNACRGQSRRAQLQAPSLSGLTVMALVIVGGILGGPGWLAAALLVAASLGWVAAAPGWPLWPLFPLFTVLGYALMAVRSRDPVAKSPTLILAFPLVLLAPACAVTLLASGAGLLGLAGVSTAPLWCVLLLGGVIGGLSTAVSGRRSDSWRFSPRGRTPRRCKGGKRT